MQTVTFTDFRNNASELITSVENGESFMVSRHGRVIAVLSPASTVSATPSWKTPALRLSVKGEGLSAAILEERQDAAVL